MTQRTNEKQQMLDIAYMKLNTHYRVLASDSEARVEWREFDPCKSVQAIATVYWPATVNMKSVVLTHTIMDEETRQ